jgi:hypothetical protein
MAVGVGRAGFIGFLFFAFVPFSCSFSKKVTRHTYPLIAVILILRPHRCVHCCDAGWHRHPRGISNWSKHLLPATQS